MDAWIFQRFNFQSQASRYIIGGNWTSESRYGRLDFPKSSVLNFTRLDTLLAAIEHPSQKIWPFKFAQIFCFKFQASQYIMGGHQSSESNDMDVRIFPELSLSISCISIHYGRQSYIRVQGYGRLNLPRASIFKFKRLNILWAVISHPSQKIWTFQFARGSIFNLKRLDTLLMVIGHPNQDMTVWICLNLPF